MKKIFILLILLLSLTSCKKKEETIEKVPITDAYGEYIKDECVIYYASQDEILNMLKHGTGVVFFSWIECPWCKRYVNNLNEACLENKLNVLYYDIHDDRENNTDFYKEVKELVNIALEEEESFDSDGNTRIYVPNVYFVSEGNIVGHDNTSSMESSSFEETAENYWDEIMESGMDRETELKINLKYWAKEVADKKVEIDSQGCDDSSGCAL